jgi:hypothetical protein
MPKKCKNAKKMQKKQLPKKFPYKKPKMQKMKKNASCFSHLPLQAVHHTNMKSTAFWKSRLTMAIPVTVPE